MARKVKLGWKVVKLSYNQPKKDKYFISSHVGELEYKFDRWTWPKDGWGPLCVFTTRKAARNFVSWEGLRVIRCKYIPSPLTKVWNCNGSAFQLYELPYGKALASAVKLIKQRKL